MGKLIPIAGYLGYFCLQSCALWGGRKAAVLTCDEHPGMTRLGEGHRVEAGVRGHLAWGHPDGPDRHQGHATATARALQQLPGSPAHVPDDYWHLLPSGALRGERQKMSHE